MNPIELLHYKMPVAVRDVIPFFWQYVLEDISWADTPLLESVGEHEPRVEDLRDTIRTAISKSLIPLRAYARAYEQFLEVNNLELNDYIK